MTTPEIELTEFNHTCGICKNRFSRREVYPEFASPPYIQLEWAGNLIARPLCAYCFKEWKNRLKIKDKDFWKEK
jgi:hypothetical protein